MPWLALAAALPDSNWFGSTSREEQIRSWDPATPALCCTSAHSPGNMLSVSWWTILLDATSVTAWYSLGTEQDLVWARVGQHQLLLRCGLYHVWPGGQDAAVAFTAAPDCSPWGVRLFPPELKGWGTVLKPLLLPPGAVLFWAACPRNPALACCLQQHTHNYILAAILGPGEPFHRS